MLPLDEFSDLEHIIAPIVRSRGLELFDLGVKQVHGTAHIEVLVDYADGGVQMEDCARVNQQICAAFDDAGICGGDYALSVCSPGLDRPLKTARDFLRVSRYDIEILASHDDAGGKTACYQGRLCSVDDTVVVLAQKTGDPVRIFLKNIQKAYVHI